MAISNATAERSREKATTNETKLLERLAIEWQNQNERTWENNTKIWIKLVFRHHLLSESQGQEAFGMAHLD